MIRQSIVRLRLGSLAAAGRQAAAAAAEGGPAAAWGGPHSAAALQLLDRWQHAGQGGGAWQQQHYSSIRHLSFWPGGGGGSSDKQQQQAQQPDSLAAAAEDAAPFEGAADASSGFAAAGGAPDAAASAAAAAAGAPGMSDLFSASAIVAAAAGAETDALALAREESWLGGKLVQSLLSWVHASTGLPWWQDIMLVTLAMRLATLPVAIMQVKNLYRLSQARPELEELMAYVKEEQARGNQNAATEHMARVGAVYRKYNCNPLKSFAGMFVQAPIFIGFFSALRALAAAKVPSLTEGGTLWFTDLTAADPTYAMPILAGLSFLAMVELGAADGMEGQPEEVRKRTKNIMRVVALIVPVFSTGIPASVFLYWTASNFFTMFQSSLLKVPLVKKVLGLPDLSKLKKPAPGAVPEAPAVLFKTPPSQRK